MDFDMRSSPWGPVQHQHTLAPGITQVSTAGHGGILLSAARAEAFPVEFRGRSWNGDRAFEEDVDWAFVAFAFPEAFSDRDLYSATRTIQEYHPDLVCHINEGPRAELVARGKAWFEEHKDLYEVFYCYRSDRAGLFEAAFLRVGDSSDRVDVTIDHRLDNRFYKEEEVVALKSTQPPTVQEPPLAGPR